MSNGRSHDTRIITLSPDELSQVSVQLKLTFDAPHGFDFREVVGYGGVGIVFRAYQRSLNREVAIKILQGQHDSDSEACQRFKEEAEITGKLQHPGIPAIYQFEQYLDGRPYLVMRLIEGTTLDRMMEQGRNLPVLSIFEQICRAVGYAHAQGYIHRDLKPANIMVGMFGEVQVMDWGLAKSIQAIPLSPEPHTSSSETVVEASHGPTVTENNGKITKFGSVLGTPGFMAPEQALGQVGKIQYQSDVFGLGAILHFMLMGKPPYSGDTQPSITEDLKQSCATLKEAGKDQGLVELCLQCLSIEPKYRPKDANALVVEIHKLYASQALQVRNAEKAKVRAEVTGTERKKRKRLARWTYLALTLALLLTSFGLSVALWVVDDERDKALEQKHLAQRAQTDAIQQRQLAEAKRGEAEAVMAFVENQVLSAARPRTKYQGQGADVTLRSAMLASLPNLGRDFVDKPMIEAKIRYTLGNTFMSLGDFAVAREQMEITLRLAEKHGGLMHSLTVDSAMALAVAYFRLGDIALAMELNQRMLDRQRSEAPEDYNNQVKWLSNLASCYSKLGNPKRGIELMEESLRIRKSILPPTHPETLGTQLNLAISYQSLNQPQKALDLVEEVVAIQKANLPPHHQDALIGRYNLANCYHSLGRHAEALAIRQENLAICRKEYPENFPEIAQQLWATSISLIQLQRGTEAVLLLEEAVTLYDRLPFDPGALYSIITLRFQHFEKLKDIAKCRECAESWEKRLKDTGEHYYMASRYRAALLKMSAASSEASTVKEEYEAARKWLDKAIQKNFLSLDKAQSDVALAPIFQYESGRQ